MLDTDYLLKLDKEGLLKNEFLVQVKLYLMKKNQETQEKLNQLAMQQKKTYEFVKGIISVAKQQVEEEGQNILVRVKASDYIRAYRKRFIIDGSPSDPNSVINIIFPDEVEDSGPSANPAGTTGGATSILPRMKPTSKTEDHLTTLSTVYDFITSPVLSIALKNLIFSGDDSRKAGAAYASYMKKLHDTLVNDGDFFKEIVLDQREKIYQEIETHVALKMHSRIFPLAPSAADTVLCKKMQLLQWVDPTTLGIRKDDLKVDYWRSASESPARRFTYR